MTHLKRLLISLLITMLTLNHTFAEESTSKPSLNQIMANIGQIMTEIYPMVLSEKKLSNTEQALIHNQIAQLQELFIQAQPHIQKKSTTYQLSFEILQEYLNSITRQRNPAALGQIKQRLITLSDLCVSCHTQDDKLRTVFDTQVPPKFDNQLNHAEFNFATRNYYEAEKYYEQYLTLAAQMSESDALKALHRIMAINLQILNRPDNLNAVFSRLLKTNNFTPTIREYIFSVIEAVRLMQTNKLQEVTSITFTELQTYVGQYLGDTNAHQPFIFASPRNEAERLWLRGVLFRYMNGNPTEDEIPYLLYWLALCDRSLGYGYDYTLADFYIKQCITHYSAHPLARRCYNEYESYVKFYFTSPTEPVIPIEVDRELKRLKKYLRQ